MRRGTWRLDAEFTSGPTANEAASLHRALPYPRRSARIAAIRAIRGGDMPVAVAVVRESAAGERRVAVTPETAKKLKSRGAAVVLERGAGASAYFADAAYVDCETAADARAALARADVLLKVQPPTLDEIAALKEGAIVIGAAAAASCARAHARAARSQDHRIRDGALAAHHARAGDGCAVLAGGGRRLQGRADRRRSRAEILSDADHRGRARSGRRRC